MKAHAYHTGGSEVAALLQQIEYEYAAARNGLSGLAQGVSRHAWITARMERVAAGEKRLAAIAGNAQAMELVLACSQALGVQEDNEGKTTIPQSWKILEQTDSPLPGQRHHAFQEAETNQVAHSSSLLLDGHVIHEGDHLVLRIFDGWIAGVVHQDHTNWYLLTAAQVPIRLWAGLTARWGNTPLHDPEEEQKT